MQVMKSSADTPVWLLQGLRPFFLGASLWSVAALALWVAVLAQGWELPTRFGSLQWHIHEMLFGFVLAAIAGFLLTAVANWTGRTPVHGRLLAGLAALWLSGRVACTFSAWMPGWLAPAIDLSFTLALLIVVARELIAAHNRRNMVLLLPLTVLGVANLLMHLQALGVGVPTDLGWRLGLAAVVILISVVGGRITPAFTRNWLMKQGRTRSLPAPPGAVDRVALGVLHAAVIAWAIVPGARPVGVLLLLAAALNLWRLLRWQGAAAVGEPLLFILHVGYAWLVVGTALLGMTLLGARLPFGAAIHALTAGAAGTMILAVMTRASRGHTGHALSADRVTVGIYLCVNGAAMVRIASGLMAQWLVPLLVLSAMLWTLAFALFACVYGPMLLGWGSARRGL